MSNMKRLIKYHLKLYVKPLLFSYGMLLSFWLMKINRDFKSAKQIATLPELQRPISGVYLGSWNLVAVSLLVFFIVSLFYHKRSLYQFNQIGVTRTQFFLSKIITVSLLSLVITLIASISQSVNYLVIKNIHSFVQISEFKEFLFYALVLLYGSILSIFVASIVTKIRVGKSLALFFVGRYVFYFIIEAFPSIYSILDKTGVITVLFWYNSFDEPFNLLSFIPFVVMVVLLFIFTYIITKRTEIEGL